MVKADNSARKIAMFKDGHLRLLMTLIGFQRTSEEDDPEGSWVIPSALSADQLKQSLDLVKKFEFSPPVFDDGQEAGDFIRRKSAGSTSRRKAVFDDEDDGIDNDTEEELLFPAGGPTMKKSDAFEALKKNRRRRRKEGSEDPGTNSLTDEQLKARAEARKQKELEKNRKIKSELYVHDSDEEPDDERDRLFFEQEEKLRERSKIAIMKELLGVGKEWGSGPAAQGRSKKRHSSAISIGSDDEDARSSSLRDNELEESDEGESATDTPMSSPHNRSSQVKRRKLASEEPTSLDQSTTEEILKDGATVIAENTDDEDVAVVRPVRQRVRAGFIVESSDEEQ